MIANPHKGQWVWRIEEFTESGRRSLRLVQTRIIETGDKLVTVEQRRPKTINSSGFELAYLGNLYSEPEDFINELKKFALPLGTKEVGIV